MSVQNILRMGNPLLYQRATEIEDLDSQKLDEIINNMLDTMKDANRVGIAAPQIGITKRIIIFGFKDNPRYPDAPPVLLTVLINPIIEILSNEIEDGWEGCLSVPGLRGLVPRYIKIKYSGYEFNSKQNIERVVDGFHARVVQHKIDHIDGVLYPHWVEDMSKLGFEGEWMIDGINKIKKTLKAILRAIIFTHRAIEYWDVIADFITDNEVNDTFSSMLGYQQKIYHYHAIIELSKIYDRDNRTLSLPNLNLPIDIILYNNNYFDLYSNKNEFTEAVKFLKDSRNIWAAHNEAPLDTKNRGKQYEGVISIASLERLLKCTKRLYTEIINFTQVDHFDPDIEYRSPESICFKNLLIKSLEH